MTAKREASIAKRIALGLIYFIILCYVCSVVANVLFGIVLGAPASLDDHLAVLDIGVDGWRSLLILMSVFPALVITGFPTRHRSSSLTERQVGVVLWLGAIIPGTVIGVLLIGYSMFETVNTELGGGRPQNAVFHFAPEGKDILTYLRNGTRPYHDSDPPMTIEGDLVYATSDRYVVRVTFCERDASESTDALIRKDKSIAVDKKLIQAVLFTRIPVSPVTRRCPYSMVH
jgi:hypothetical protein